MKKAQLFAAIILLTTTSFTAVMADPSPLKALKGETISICGDAGWPPFTFTKDSKVQGFDIALLDKILPPAGIKFIVETPSWKRCLYGVEIGRYQLALSASYSVERSRQFIYTNTYYNMRGKIYYSPKHFPQGIALQSPKDLLNYNTCGIFGYNYSDFGVNNADIDRNSHSFDQLIKRIKAGRCDLFLAWGDILSGFTLLGKSLLDPELASFQMPNQGSDKFYMLISQKYSKAILLQQLLNNEIDRLSKQGELKKLLAPFLRPGAKSPF